MKKVITGMTAWDMTKNAERTYTERVKVSDDAWWGATYIEKMYVVYNGITYIHERDNGDWDVLIEA